MAARPAADLDANGAGPQVEVVVAEEEVLAAVARGRRVGGARSESSGTGMGLSARWPGSAEPVRFMNVVGLSRVTFFGPTETSADSAFFLRRHAARGGRAGAGA